MDNWNAFFFLFQHFSPISCYSSSLVFFSIFFSFPCFLFRFPLFSTAVVIRDLCEMRKMESIRREWKCWIGTGAIDHRLSSVEVFVDLLLEFRFWLFRWNTRSGWSEWKWTGKPFDRNYGMDEEIILEEKGNRNWPVADLFLRLMKRPPLQFWHLNAIAVNKTSNYRSSSPFFFFFFSFYFILFCFLHFYCFIRFFIYSLARCGRYVESVSVIPSSRWNSWELLVEGDRVVSSETQFLFWPMHFRVCCPISFPLAFQVGAAVMLCSSRTRYLIKRQRRYRCANVGWDLNVSAWHVASVTIRASDSSQFSTDVMNHDPIEIKCCCQTWQYPSALNSWRNSHPSQSLRYLLSMTATWMSILCVCPWLHDAFNEDKSMVWWKITRLNKKTEIAHQWQRVKKMINIKSGNLKRAGSGAGIKGVDAWNQEANQLDWWSEAAREESEDDEFTTCLKSWLPTRTNLKQHEMNFQRKQRKGQGRSRWRPGQGKVTQFIQWFFKE